MFRSGKKDAAGSRDVFTVGIGGAAGDGAREAGASLSAVLAALGFEVYTSFDYPSLIRGGHNFSRVSFSGEKIHADHAELDMLVALNDETLNIHRKELRADAVVFADHFEEKDRVAFGGSAVALPMREFAEKAGAPSIVRTSAALGAACYLLSLPLAAMRSVLGNVFKEKNLEANLKLAEAGYEHLAGVGLRHWKKMTPCRDAQAELVDGNTAVARGLVAAGLDFYFSYPMTPSSSILHFLARHQEEYQIKVVQPENEIAVAAMALGASYAGARAAVGTATGGFALMQEAFSLAGMAEVPLAVAVSQRYAPATGTPTYTAQADLEFVIHAGHGEFPRIVLAPGDAAEAFAAGGAALNLAWKYQTPAVVLLDRQLSESLETCDIAPQQVAVERGKVWENAPASYARYRILPDGVSPLAFPGTPGVIVKADSYEHDEEGLTTEDAAAVKAMNDKRFAKGKEIAKEMKEHETVKVYADRGSRDVVVFWGSTKGAVLEAAKYVGKPLKLVQVLWMEPFDAEKVATTLAKAATIVDVEANHTAQLASLVHEKTGIAVHRKILKYDSRPFDPTELAEKLRAAFS